MEGSYFMYIQPNSTIIILKNVPLDNTYRDTILFNDRAEQGRYYIDNYRKFSLERYHYQRVNAGYIKVERTADDLYDCNYLMFQNTTYGQKWFYAFITGVDYINDSVAQIRYEIDDMQTWHFDYQLRECFVEREHSPLDSPEDCWVAESLATGDYITNAMEVPLELQNTSIVLFSTINRDYHGGEGIYNNGLFSGLYPIDFPNTPSGVAECTEWIRNLPILKMNAILCAVIMPSFIVDQGNWGEVGFEINPHTYAQNDMMKLNDIGTLTPVLNRKCYYYPYNFLYVSNNQGSCAEYKYELFDFSSERTKCYFSAWADITPNSSIIMYPNFYGGIANDYEEKMSLSGFPQVAFNLDSFKLWLSQASASIATTGVALAGGVATGQIREEALKEPSTKIMDIAKVGVGVAVASTVASGLIASARPPQARGTQQSASLLVAGLQNFIFYNKRIKPEYARIIDDYFTAYGYACHRIKIPNINARPSWNYVKTIGCKIVGSMPADSIANIKSIFDRGITFWKKGTVIGDYTQNNAPVI